MITDNWTRCELEVHRNFLWFARKIVFGRYICNTNCITKTSYAELNLEFVNEAECVYLRLKVIDSRVIQLNHRREMREEKKGLNH